MKTIGLWLLVIVLLASPAFPQASTGTISGTVRDQTGAVVVAAPVVLTNTATNTVVRTSSNESGFYLFPGLIPGGYRLVVEVPGMEKYEATLTLNVQASAVVDVTLKVAAAAAQVFVTDVTPVLTVNSATLGEVLDRNRMEQLPINGRAVTNLLFVVPGNDGLRAYGMRFMSQEMTLDGAYLVNNYWGDRVTHQQPGLDSIQEMNVVNNNASAEYSRPTTIVLATKSGTNQIHGSFFETNRNSGYGVARARTDAWSKPPYLNRNEFGGSAGGPVYLPKIYNGKNRTFWFFGYEGSRQVNPTFSGVSLPTPAMRNGDFSGLVDAQGRLYTAYNPWTTNSTTWSRQPFSYGGKLNAVDPSLMSPLAKYLLSVTPLPNTADNPLVTSNWWGEWPNWTRSSVFSARLDHHFTDRDRFYATYNKRPWDSFTQGRSFPTGNPDIGSDTYTGPSQSLALNYLHVFSTTLFNTLLASAGRDIYVKGTGVGHNYEDQLGMPNALHQTGWFNLSQAQLPGYLYAGDAYQGQYLNSMTVDDNAVKIFGKHELKFGFHTRYDQDNILADQNTNSYASPNTGATSLYDPSSSRSNPLATPLTGSDLVNEYLGILNYQNILTQKWFYDRSHDYALYLQDNFRATPRLTLNLGLRWEYYASPVEKYNQYNGFDQKNHAVILGTPLSDIYRLGNTTPSIVAALQGLGVKFESYQDAGWPKGLMTAARKNFAPRVGFAYRGGDGARSFVLRGGYSISYFPMNTRTYNMAASWNMPTSATFEWSDVDPAVAPDGIGNYGMRSVPTVIAGLNSADAISLEHPVGITAGSNSTISKFSGQPDQMNGRVQQWNVTLEKEVAKATIVRVTYQGSHSDRLLQNHSLNDATPSNVWYVSTGLPLPTGPRANVATRPYDNTTYGYLWSFLPTGYMNEGGMQFQLERRHSNGYSYQIFYTVTNGFGDVGSQSSGGAPGADNTLPCANQYLPGTVPLDDMKRDRLLDYRRDTTFPKHEIRWNWLIELPVGKGKKLLGNAGRVLNQFVGGWGFAGLGTMTSNWWSLPTNIWPNGNPIQIYGKKYPIQDCTSGVCYPAYLYWNGYLPANLINSHNAAGKANGYEGVPADYTPAATPLIPWGTTTLPPNAPPNTNLSAYWDTNTIWVSMKDGTVQRTTTPAFHPWYQQYILGPWLWSQDASLFKKFQIGDRCFVRFNVDAFNVLNHPGNPPSIASTGLQSLRSSAQAARQLQLTLRFTW